MAKRGLSLVDDIFNRIKELEGVENDVDLAPLLLCGRLQPGQWRSRQIVPWARVVRYSREHERSLEYLVNGHGPAQRIDLTDAVAEPGAIYRVETDQDVVYKLAADIHACASELSDGKFLQALKLLHREYLDTGKYPPQEKIAQLVRMAS